MKVFLLSILAITFSGSPVFAISGGFMNSMGDVLSKFDSRKVEKAVVRAEGCEKPYNGGLVGGTVEKIHIYTPENTRPLHVETEQGLSPEIRLTKKEKEQLMATGGVLCSDGSYSSGFIADVSEFEKKGSGNDKDYDVIVTNMHALFNDDTGLSRGKCFYVSADGPNRGHYYEIQDLSVERNGKYQNTPNENDFVFAKIAKISHVYGALKIDFSDQYDYELSPASRKKYLSSAYNPRRGTPDISLNCSPDSKLKYKEKKQSDANFTLPQWEKIVIHNCGYVTGGSGGVLARRSSDGLKVIALNVGYYGGPQKGGVGIKYDPPTTFNGSRKFDTEMKERLAKYVIDSSNSQLAQAAAVESKNN